MSSLCTGAVALFFLGMGLYGLVAPRALIRPFGIELTVPEARAEVRAVYGGFGVAVGALLAWAALGATGDLRSGVVLTVAVSLAGMAFGRLVARAVERPSEFFPSWFYFWVEVVGAALLIIGL
ncbi:membrane protein [Streptomyces olindensis]|nr:membrane protein [Streptomyces olindensis]